MDKENHTTSAVEGSRSSRPAIHVPADVLERVHDLYLRGLNLDALAAAREAGSLEDWTGADAMVLAGRLAGNLGGMRLAARMHILARRREPHSPRALYYFTRTVLDRKGPYGAWLFMKSQPGPADTAPHILADWLAMKGSLAAMLRDFGTAEKCIRQAMEIAPGRPWIWVERAFVLQQEDRHEEALESARRSMEIRPWYRPGVQTAAQLLATLNRDAEALELLEEAHQRTQSAPITAQLAVTLSENHAHQRARELWERVVELAPLADRDFKKYLCARRCDAAYDCGDYAAAAELARGAGKGFFEKIAARLSEDLTDRNRVELDVPFVQQHHMTCAPATLAAISRYWGKSTEHLEIVESICYDGTPSHSERAWAESHGYVCREFRVTWASAAALIDRGVPFTLATVEATSAHLQAITGYDARRGTLLLRDPSWKFANELLAEGLAQRYKSSGPRGMALAPLEKAGLLEGIALPEAELYELFNQVQRTLVAHRRDEAAQFAAKMEQLDAGHRLTIWARRSLAAYDADLEAQLKCTGELLALYPDDTQLQLHKVSMLRNLARRSEILATLEQACARPERDPIFLQYFAEELGMDAREIPRAAKILRRCIQYRPTDPGAYFVLGNLLWRQRQFEEALELHRFATCLNDKDDQLAMTWFNAARHFKQTDEAIALLRDRFVRFGGRSSIPARTLFRALATVDRPNEGFEILEQAMARRPEDGELLLFAADAYVRYGNTARASELIERAGGHAHPTLYRRSLATLATYRGELSVALQMFLEILEDDPLSTDAQESAAQLLAETQGREAALAHLRAACARFECNYPLQQLYINWLRAEHIGELEQVLRRLIEVRPGDAWLIRELAHCLMRQGRIEEAVAAAQEAIRIDPNHSLNHGAAARIYAAAGRTREAQASARHALELSIDNDDAMQELMGTCATVAQRKEALAFICAELVKQVTYGDGLLAYRLLANETLDGKETLKTLCEALEARRDLWQAWAAKALQLTDLNRLEEARRLLEEALEHFPLHPRLWLDLARVQSLCGDGPAESESLDMAVAIAPAWGPTVRALSDAKCRVGDCAEARRILERGIAWAPLDAPNYGYLADVLWKMGERAQAIENLRKALRLSPAYDWAWSMLKQWAPDAGQPQAAVELARELTRRRAGEGRSWFTLARMLEGPGAVEQQLEALKKVSELEPLNVECHSFRAALLARRRRYDEALAACRPAVFGDPPILLKGRAAWVWAERGDRLRAIADMQKVVAEDPRFTWGWMWLADWCRDAGRNEEFLQAAETLIHLTPIEPSAWCYLGEARERAGKLGEAKAAFERTLALDPSWGPAIRRLALLKCRSGDHAGARQVVEAGLTCSPQDPMVHGAMGEVLWEQGEESAALEQIRKAIRLAVNYEWAWGRLGEWGPRAGQAAAAVDLARELSRDRPGELMPWVVLARTLEGRETVAERLEALGRAGEIDPLDVEVHELRVCILAQDGRFDEAQAACSPAGFNALPIILRGRHAWVWAKRGDVGRAVREMGELVKKDPQFAWGWTMLARWHRDAGNNAEFLRASERLVQVASQDAMAWSCQGEALERLEKIPQAIESYERALKLDPAYTFAGLSICDLRMQAGEIDAAEAALEAVSKHDTGPGVGMRRVQLLAKRGSAEQATRRSLRAAAEALEALCVQRELQASMLTAACEAMDGAGCATDADDVLNLALALDDSAGAVGEVWSQRLVARGQWDAMARSLWHLLEGVAPDAPVRQSVQRAAAGFLESAGRAGERNFFDYFVQRFRAVLHAHDEMWTGVAGGLIGLKRYRQCAAWQSDWAQRPGLEPWMLSSLCTAHFAMKRFDEAMRVARGALSLATQSDATNHHLWWGIGLAWEGRFDEAHAQREAAAGESLGEHQKFLLELLDALLTQAESGAAGFARARQLMSEAARGHRDLAKYRSARAIYRRTVRAIGMRRGGLAGIVWRIARTLANWATNGF